MSATTKKLKVLLFDDDEMFCRMMKQVGKKQQVSVLTCATMEEFCLHALEGDFDLVILDYFLDRYIGTEVALVVDKKPVIIVSGATKDVKNRQHIPKEVIGMIDKEIGPKKVLRMATQMASDLSRAA